MNKDITNDDFIAALDGKKFSGMEPKWRVLGKIARNFILDDIKKEEQELERIKQDIDKRMIKVLEERSLIKKKKIFHFKNWFLILAIGSSGAFATKEFVHFTKPLPLELTFTQEELEGQDPKLFWKKWFNNGTFVMFGQKTISKPVPTNLTDCQALKDCLGLLKNNPHNPNLLFNIALKYESGKDKDIDKALEFYKRSMALGNFYAQFNYDNLIKNKTQKR